MTTQLYSVEDQKAHLNEILFQIPALFIPENSESLDGAYQVLFTDLDYPWFTLIEQARCTTYQGFHDAPVVTMMIEYEDFIAMSYGRLSETFALMTKRLKLEGNLLKAIKYSKHFRKLQLSS